MLFAHWLIKSDQLKKNLEDSLWNLNVNWTLDDVKVFVLLDVIMVLCLHKKMLFLEMYTEAFWVKYLDGCDLI